MKKILLLLFIGFANLLYAQAPKTLYEQLVSVNELWKNQTDIESSLKLTPAKPMNEQQLVHFHLQQVELLLRKKNVSNLSSAQQQQREKNLNTLHGYWQNGVFPINDLHENRQPYFIDKYNTYCAVGYLMQKSGANEMAKEIHDKQNYSYLLDINHPQLIDWVSKSGLTLSELALIQPTYGGEMPPVLMEMHYNNTGTDVNEYIEVKQGNYIVTFNEIRFYNQSSMLYKTLAISQMQSFTGSNYYYIFPSNESFADDGYVELRGNSGLIATITYSSTSVTVTQVAWGTSTKTYNVGESESTPVGNSLGFTGLYNTASWNLLPTLSSMATLNIGASFPTPISLSKFDYSINNKTVQLSWETISESNNSYFSIEKSSDGINFQSIGKVNGAGSSNSLKKYLFVDFKPAYISHYRLKQVDFDGKSTYSKILFAKVQQANPLSIAENPVKKDLQVQINLETIKPRSLIIFDFLGRKIKSFNLFNGTQNLDVSTLSAGKYLLQLLTTDGKAFNQQFIKAE